MTRISEMIYINDDGHHTYVKKSDCELVIFWKEKYKAVEMKEWKKENSNPLLFELNTLFVSGFEPGEIVWAVESATGAFTELDLIRRFITTNNSTEYKNIRQNIIDRGYPHDIVDSFHPPE